MSPSCSGILAEAINAIHLISIENMVHSNFMIYVYVYICLFVNAYYVFIYLSNSINWKSRTGVNSSYEYLA